MQDQKCLHPSCGCTGTLTSDYCSAECARAAVGGIATEVCECGHPICHAAARISAADEE